MNKNMKKYILPVLAIVGSVAFTSCEDELDIKKKGVVSSSEFYKTDADCEKTLVNVYENFLVNTLGRTTVDSNAPGIYTPARVLANHAGDDVNYGGGNYGDHEFGGSIDEFRYNHTPQAIEYHYRGLYLSVKACNTLIANYSTPSSTEFQKQAVAEARVIRAYDSFLLACYWGQPPLIDRVLPGDYVPTNSEMTQQQYFQWVASECEAALGDLSERKSKADKDGAVRVTKGFANALAGKAYLFAKDYTKAAAAFKKVIDSDKYALVSGEKYADLFHVEGDCNEEKVFEINMDYNANASDWSYGSGLGYLHHSTWMEANCFNWRAGNFVINPAGKYCGIDGWGSIGVPQWFGDEFFANEGHSHRFDATLMHIDDAVYHTSGVKGMDYADASLNSMSVDELKVSTNVGIKDVTQGLYGQSFWLPFKNIVRASDCVADNGSTHGSNVRLNNIIVMRYAEVLLDYAECCLQNGNADEAKTYINMIQTRAGAPVSATVDMEVLKKEKSYELWFEGCRFQDVLRWQDANAIARLEKAGTKVPHLFDKLFRAPHYTDGVDADGKPYKADVDITWEHGTEENSRFYTVHTHEAMDAGYEVGFKKGKHELFPYPPTVIEANPALKQNPGW